MPVEHREELAEALVALRAVRRRAEGEAAVGGVDDAAGAVAGVVQGVLRGGRGRGARGIGRRATGRGWEEGRIEARCAVVMGSVISLTESSKLPK